MLNQQTVLAEVAFQDADPNGVVGAARFAREVLPCAGERLLAAEAAALHRLFAYEVFLERDLMATESWFSAAKAADPSYQIPVTVLPERHPLRGVYDIASPTAAEARVAVPRDQAMWVDGERADTVPLGRPYLLQVVHESGQVDTHMMAPDALPSLVSDEPQGPSIQLAISAQGSTLFGEGGLQGYAGPALRLHIPVVGPLFVEAAAGLPIAARVGGAYEGLYMLPTGMAGLALRSRGDVQPWASLGGLLISDVPGVRAGLGGAIGVDVPVGRLTFTPEIRGGGWSGVAMIGGGVGVQVGR